MACPRCGAALWPRRSGRSDKNWYHFGWSLGVAGKVEIDGILRKTITDPVGPELDPTARLSVSSLKAAQ
jgi:hypothetical protein